MIRLKEARFARLIPGLTSSGGVTLVKDEQVCLYLDVEAGCVFANPRKGGDTVVIPFASVEYARMADRYDGADGGEPLVPPKPVAVQVFAPAAPPKKAVDDKVRMVKIGGKIVERTGEPKQDEIDALEEAKLERLTRPGADPADDDLFVPDEQ